MLEPIEIPGVVRAAHVGFLVFCLLSPLALAQQSVDVAFLEQARQPHDVVFELLYQASAFGNQ